MSNLLRSGGRKIVGHASRKGMPDVKVRIAAINIGIGERGRRVDVSTKGAARKGVGGGVVDRVGECITNQGFDTPRQRPLELELEGIIVRRGGIVGQHDIRKVRVHVREMGDAQQVATGGADVCE